MGHDPPFWPPPAPLGPLEYSSFVPDTVLEAKKYESGDSDSPFIREVQIQNQKIMILI